MCQVIFYNHKLQIWKFFLNLHQEFIGELIRKKLAPEDRSVTDDDLAIVEFVCKLLSERCALLVCSTFMCDPVTILLCDFVTVALQLLTVAFYCGFVTVAL